MTPEITGEDVRAALADHLLPGVAVQVERSVRQHALRRVLEEQHAKVEALSNDIAACLESLRGDHSGASRERLEALFRKRDVAEKRARQLWDALSATWKEAAHG